MEVTSVRYERLFSLEGYHNERISFEARLDEGESEEEAVGELFFKVAEIEDVFQAYRSCLGWLDKNAHDIDYDVRRIAELERRIAEMKVSIEKLARGELDERLKAACDRESLKSLRAQLEHHRKDLEKHEREKATLTKQFEELRKNIKKGDFSPNETVKSLLKTRQEIY